MQGPDPSWDFKVVDNTSSQALYAMDLPVLSFSRNITGLP